MVKRREYGTEMDKTKFKYMLRRVETFMYKYGKPLFIYEMLYRTLKNHMTSFNQ